MTQDYYKVETTKRYDIPLTHLDYGYIRECTNVKELEKILRVLRSGDEGLYPELEKEAETKLEQLNPASRVLRKDNPVLRPSDLDRSEKEDFVQDLESWGNDMADREQKLSARTVGRRPAEEDHVFADDPTLPPIRSGKVISVDGKVKEDATNSTEKSSKQKKVMPRSYKEWDKVDIDEELSKVDGETPEDKKNVGHSTFEPAGISQTIDTGGMSAQEKRAKAVREKDKGNEAFHARDFEESIVYYTRSISIDPLAATYNNRALAYLRLSKWNGAIKDCNTVLEMEPKNIKALLRRGTALKGKADFSAARSDLDTVLSMESNNKTAQDLLKEITKLEEKASKPAAARKQKGRRMVIEEVESSDEEEEDGETPEEIIVEKPDSKKKEAPLVNGHVEVPKAPPPSAEPAEQESNFKAADLPPEGSPLSKLTDVASKEHVETSESKKPKTNKDIWTEEETEPAQQQEAKVCNQKPNLVTTNILSNQTKPQNGPKVDVCQSNSSEKSGVIEDTVSAQTNILPDSQKQDTAALGDKSKQSSISEAAPSAKTEKGAAEEKAVSHQNGVSEDPESAQAGEEDEEENSVAEETVHSRPVFVKKSFSPLEASLREEGNDLFRTGHYPEAIKVYTKLITRLEKGSDQTVNLSLIYSNRAACYQKIGDCQASIADSGTSLSLVPHSAKPLLRRAAAYETLEKYRQAYVDYKHIISIDSSVVTAHQGASRCQHTLQNMDGIRWREKLPPLVRVSQWDIPEIIQEGDEKNMPTQSSKQLPASTNPVKEKQSSVSEKPQQKPTAVKDVPAEKVPSPEERFEQTKAKGNKHVQKGEYKAAAECYCQCVDLFSDRAAIYTNRALCYLKLNKAAQAEEDCNKALALEPCNFKAFYRRALARKALKHYKDSLQDLLQLLRLEPTNTAAKKEMEVVKGLYKEEYDQLKAQPATEKKKPPEAEKKRKRMKIEEVEEDTDGEEKDSHPPQASGTKTKVSGAAQKPPTTTTPRPPSGTTHKPSASQPSNHTDKQPATRPAETRKPGRGKSKKGGIKETSVGLPVTPPSAPKLQGKITPFEFLQHWNSLKQATEIQPYVQLLEQISPDELPAVISNKLDGHMLQIIARCAAHDAQTGEVERAYSILRNVRQVPRFSTVVMFLSNKEKQDIRKVLDTMNSLGTRSSEEVAAVRKEYGLK